MSTPQFLVSQIGDGNMAWRHGSAPSVTENRERWFEKNKVKGKDVVLASLVGGADIRFVTVADAGVGILTPDLDIPDADILISDDPNLKLMTVLADCLGVAVFDPANHAIGLAHAGYRGVDQYVPTKMVEAMIERFDSNPADLIVQLTPGLNGSHSLFSEGQMEERLTETFWAGYTEESGDVERPWRVDWIQAALDQLAELGVAVPEYPSDTFTGPYFSHRRSVINKEAEGRFAVLVGWQ